MGTPEDPKIDTPHEPDKLVAEKIDSHQPGKGPEFSQEEVDAFIDSIENPPPPSPEAKRLLDELGLCTREEK